MNKKILLISSAGGHFNELKKIHLEEEFQVKYVVEQTPSNKQDQQIDYFLKTGSRSYLFKYFYVFFLNFWKSLIILMKEKPDYIISTGAHSCVSFFWLAKILKIKSIYIESFAKVQKPSLTYKLIVNFTDLILVQHPEMLKVYPKAKYFGGLY